MIRHFLTSGMTVATLLAAPVVLAHFGFTDALDVQQPGHNNVNGDCRDDGRDTHHAYVGSHGFFLDPVPTLTPTPPAPYPIPTTSREAQTALPWSSVAAASNTCAPAAGDVWDGDFEWGYGGAFLPVDHHAIDPSVDIWFSEAICVRDDVFGQSTPYVIGSDVDDDGYAELTSPILTGCNRGPFVDVDGDRFVPGAPYSVPNTPLPTPLPGGYWVFVGLVASMVDAGSPFQSAVFFAATQGHVCTTDSGARSPADDGYCS